MALHLALRRVDSTQVSFRFGGLDKAAPDTVNPSLGGIAPASPDTIRAMPPEMLFDYFGVRLNGPKAVGEISLTGNKAAFDEFLGLLDRYPFWFPIATP